MSSRTYLSIGDVLHLSAEDAAAVFSHHPRIARPLATLADLGVGYIQIGQGSNSLSGCRPAFTTSSPSR